MRLNWTFDFWRKKITVHFRDTTCFHFIMQTRSTKFSLSRIEPFCFHTPELATCHLDSKSCNFIMCCFYNLQYLQIFCFLIFFCFSASRAWIRIAPLAFQLWLYGILDLHTEVRKYKYPHIMRLKAPYRTLVMSASVLKSQKTNIMKWQNQTLNGQCKSIDIMCFGWVICPIILTFGSGFLFSWNCCINL